MECQCGATVPSSIRACPQCGRLMHPHAPPDCTFFPGRPHHLNARISTPKRKRRSEPLPSSQRTPTPSVERPSRNPSEHVLPSGHRTRQGDSLVPPPKMALRQEPASRAIRPGSDLPKGTVSGVIELRGVGAETFRSPRSASVPPTRTYHLVLIAIKRSGARSLLRISKQFTLDDETRPTRQAIDCLAGLRQLAVATGFVEKRLVFPNRWYVIEFSTRRASEISPPIAPEVHSTAAAVQHSGHGAPIDKLPAAEAVPVPVTAPPAPQILSIPRGTRVADIALFALQRRDHRGGSLAWTIVSYQLVLFAIREQNYEIELFRSEHFPLEDPDRPTPTAIAILRRLHDVAISAWFSRLRRSPDDGWFVRRYKAPPLR